MLPQRSGLLLRNLGRARHVAATEGLQVLAAKVLRRLRTTPFVVRDRLERIPADGIVGAPAFRSGRAPVVSIVVPVFNHYPVTRRCLAVLSRHRSVHPFEVIVVDDGSSDETSVELARWTGLRVVRNGSNLGFVRSANRGAEVATGSYLVFLNNDTEVQPGWLDTLIATFEVQRDAGLVGSCLIYPSGRLQEAGGVVFEDGSAWNYGQLDDPHRPHYRYVREADYVSAASMAVRRALFEALGGFDPVFAPGYYEDVDLAFRVRTAGLRVYYQPASRVVHVEGVTAGRDERSDRGMKRFQALHREVFLARWRHELQGVGRRAEDVERQKERRVTARALVVDVYMLAPDKDSGSLRMVNLMRILQDLGFKITFAASNLEAPEPYVSQLQQQGVEVLYRPYVKTLERHLRSGQCRYDWIILSRADTATALIAAARRHCPQARVIFDTVDLHFLRESRLARLTGERGRRAVATRRKEQELSLVRQADTTWVVSPVERDLLAREVPGAEVRVVSNVHRIPGRRRGFAERRDLLFVGAFAHPPNVDAMLWFCRDVFPLIRAQRPEVRLHLVGAGPPRRVLALASEHVRVLGHVPVLEPLLDGARLSVAPLRYGAGVKGKINQSLAYGLPVVATAQAAEGMYLEHGVSALLAEDAAGFAREVLRAYTDETLWHGLSEGGLAVMEAHFGFGAGRRALAQQVRS